MRIALELLGLVPGQIGGMETYARNLLRGLAATCPNDEFLVLVGREARGTSPDVPNFREIVVDDEFPGIFKRFRYGKSLVQWFTMERILKKWNHDLLHCTLNLPRPAWGAPKMALTLPDLNFELFPEHWGKIGSRVMKAHTRLGARRARIIFTLSEFSKREIVHRYSIAPSKIAVVGCGVNRVRFQALENPPRPESKVPDRYFFFPANTWPHKNHVRVIEALAILKQKQNFNCPIVFTGAAKHGHPAFEAAIRRHNLGDSIHWLGYVSADELARLYQNAVALVFPSLHEGFGLPVLEAMACGCPVICSNTTGVGEIAGEAAMTVDPTNVEAIASAMAELWENPIRREDLRAKGLQRANMYTWDRTVQTTVEGYRKCTNG